MHREKHISNVRHVCVRAQGKHKAKLVNQWVDITHFPLSTAQYKQQKLVTQIDTNMRRMSGTDVLTLRRDQAHITLIRIALRITTSSALGMPHSRHASDPCSLNYVSTNTGTYKCGRGFGYNTTTPPLPPAPARKGRKNNTSVRFMFGLYPVCIGVGALCDGIIPERRKPSRGVKYCYTI